MRADHQRRGITIGGFEHGFDIEDAGDAPDWLAVWGITGLSQYHFDILCDMIHFAQMRSVVRLSRDKRDIGLQPPAERPLLRCKAWQRPLVRPTGHGGHPEQDRYRCGDDQQNGRDQHRFRRHARCVRTFAVHSASAKPGRAWLRPQLLHLSYTGLAMLDQHDLIDMAIGNFLSRWRMKMSKYAGNMRS
ncbi:hypothetical protein [Sphingobium yanoikuyae]|uniref:hypothetical protein n=1 Tax=Sphingobium yanoikuyae TaxID=13690 RepID=UPI00345E1CA4